jgi:DNA repair protein RecO (recombination protein O)
MHKIYVTEGVVLGKRGVGEANTLISILTQELGLVRASAKSARLERSKLRYGLETLTLARFSLVRGKHEWRLTGVEKSSRDCMPPTPARRAQAGRAVKLVLRLVQGEEPTAALYQSVVEGLASLAQAANDADAEALECVLVLRILSHLGYLPQRPELAPFIEESFFSLELAAAAARSRSLLVRTINESLGATGL